MRALVQQVMSFKERSVKRSYWTLTSLSFEHNNFIFAIHYFIRVSVYKGLYEKHGVQKRTYRIMLVIFYSIRS
jgi:hypothetical protein